MISVEPLKQALKQLGIEKQFDYILVGGTNGKGSTTFMIAEGLRSMGYNVVHTQSPHIEDVRERINFNINKISKKKYINYMEILDNFELSFFEKHAAIAFMYAIDMGADVLVGEVGLGGARDAMNVFEKDIAVITSLGWDHWRFFKTWEKMVWEKFSIVKDAKKYVGIYNDILLRFNAETYLMGKDYKLYEWWLSQEGTYANGFFTPMVGSFQRYNLLHSAKVLEFYGDNWRLSKKLPRRMEKFSKGFLDGAHNIQALNELMITKKLLGLDLPIVIAIKETKQWKNIPFEFLIYPERLGEGYVPPKLLKDYYGYRFWEGDDAIFAGTLFHDKNAIERYQNNYSN